MLKRVAAIGDIHAEAEALERVLDYVLPLADVIMAVGDIVDGFGDVVRCCELLRTHAVQTVRGNHERWLLNDEMRVLRDANLKAQFNEEWLEWLNALPSTRMYDTADGPLMLCHGVGENDMVMLKPDDYGYALQSNTALEKLLYETGVRYVICGHTHQRMVRRIDNVTFLNAGTLKKFQDPCFFVVNFDDRTVQYFEVEEAVVKAGELQPLP